MPEVGIHCQAIIESRHVDVLEMDAASHTGIDDVREIIDNARYRPVMARTKVYIIDEVHMLSKAAFNGLLKTLEEPPEHVKFLFATTEIDKVPVTVAPAASASTCAASTPACSPSICADLRRGRMWRSRPTRSPSSRAPPKARCATRCRCSIRPSHMAPRGGAGRVGAEDLRAMLGSPTGPA